MDVKFEVYVDASYDPGFGLAVIGKKVGREGDVSARILDSTTNTAAEILAVIDVLDCYSNVSACSLTIYTDCQTVVDLASLSVDMRRFNKPEYAKFYDLYDLYGGYGGRCNIVKVAGHKNRMLRNDVEEAYSELDRYVKKVLRDVLKTRKAEMIKKNWVTFIGH